MYNFTYWSEHFFELSFLGYEMALGFIFYPLLFSGIIGYVYLKNQSAVAGAVAILIIVAAFGNYMLQVSLWMSFLYIVVSLIFAGLILAFLAIRSGG